MLTATCAFAVAAGQAADAAEWLDAQGRPNANAQSALRLLATAADDGLDPRDYQAGELALLAARLDDGGNATSTDEFVRALQAAMLRYMRYMHAGRIDPRSLGFLLGSVRKQAPDFGTLLDEATAARRLPAAVAELRPGLSQYDRLRSALAHYRALAQQPAWPPLPATPTVRPGQAYGHAAALHQRLVTLGDLPAETPAPAAPLYDDTLVSGVAHFQARHSLAIDCVLGRATHTALNVPIASHMRQIELAMERLRWLPRLDMQRFIGINIPMFRLWAWNPAPRSDRPRADALTRSRPEEASEPLNVSPLTQEVRSTWASWWAARSIRRRRCWRANCAT